MAEGRAASRSGGEGVATGRSSTEEGSREGRGGKDECLKRRGAREGKSGRSKGAAGRNRRKFFLNLAALTRRCCPAGKSCETRRAFCATRLLENEKENIETNTSDKRPPPDEGAAFTARPGASEPAHGQLRQRRSEVEAVPRNAFLIETRPPVLPGHRGHRHRHGRWGTHHSDG